MTDADRLYRSLPVRELQLGDATLPYRCHGSGPDLLLIHGFPLSGYTWRQVLPELAQHHRCHVVDLAGLGDSHWRDDADFTFTGHARRLKSMAEQVGLERYDILAQDTGATVARCLALLDPEHARRQVLINTEIPGHRPPWIVEYQLLMRLPFTLAIFRQLLKSRMFLRSSMAFGGSFCDLDQIDGDFQRRFVQPLIEQPLIEQPQRLEGLRHYLLGIHWPTLDALATRHAELREAVLLLWGEEDKTFPLAQARQMLPQFREARLVSIPGTRLLPQEEKPAEVVKATLEFLGA